MRSWIFTTVVVAFSLVPLATTHAAEPCKRTTFKSKLLADACGAGGQKTAKDAMKKFVKEAKSKKAGLECATCHSKTAPDYPLTDKGLDLFKQLGGV